VCAFFRPIRIFNYAGIVLHELANSLSAQTPKAREVADAVVLFESSVLAQHGYLTSFRLNSRSPFILEVGLDRFVWRFE